MSKDLVKKSPPGHPSLATAGFTAVLCRCSNSCDTDSEQNVETVSYLILKVLDTTTVMGASLKRDKELLRFSCRNFKLSISVTHFHATTPLHPDNLQITVPLTAQLNTSFF